MSDPSYLLVDDARRLAAEDVGDAPWAQRIVELVGAASDDDLGTAIVARAALARVAEERAAELVAEKARDEERRRAEAERVASMRRDRNRQRRSRLRGQITARGLTSLGYCTFAGYLGAAASWASPTPGWARFWEQTQPLLISCLVTVALAMIVDWFLDNPNGTLRAFAATVGFCIGASAWAEIFSIDAFRDVTGELLVMPWAFGIGWIVGSCLEFGSNRLSAAFSATNVGREIARTSGWRIVPTSVAALTGASALFIAPFTDARPDFFAGVQQTVERVGFLHIGLLGIGRSTTAVLVVAIVACLLHAAAPTLARVSKPLGVTVAIVEPLLGILVFLAYAPNVLSLLLGWITGFFS